jgi:hypothetical protein
VDAEVVRKLAQKEVRVWPMMGQQMPLAGGDDRLRT